MKHVHDKSIRGICFFLLIVSSVSCSYKSNQQTTAAKTTVKLGLGYLEQDQKIMAKAKLNHALALDPRLPEAHSAMAYYFEKVGNLREAEYKHKKAIRLADKKGAFYNNYGAFLCNNARFIEAEETFLVALKDPLYEGIGQVKENIKACRLQKLGLDHDR